MVKQSLEKLLRWLVIGLPFPLIFLNGWLLLKLLQSFQNLITIFVGAILLAFLLNYPVQFLEHRGLKRNRAVLVVFLLTLVNLITLGVTLVPFLLQQVDELVQQLPNWVESGSQQLEALSTWALNRGLPLDFRGLDTQLTERLPQELGNLTDEVVDFVIGAVSSVTQVAFIIVLGFYLLVDGPVLWDRWLKVLPPRWSGLVQQSLRQNFRNYFIGQISLSPIVASLFTLAFLALQVPFALLFGLGIGVMALFPFGDTAGYLLVSLLLASQDVWLGAKTLMVALVIDQVIDNLIAPRILGELTGLRPLWVLVALLIGASLGGVLGLILAIPTASFLKSVVDSLDNQDLEQLSASLKLDQSPN